MEKTTTTTTSLQSEITEYLNEQNKHFMQMAEEYIKQVKVRKTFYLHNCSTDYDDSEPAYYHAYTDEQAARIKQIFIDRYNAGDPDAEPVDNIKTVFDDLKAFEVEGEDKELDALVFDHVNEQGYCLDSIDFDDPCHLYRFSCYGYDEREGKLCAKRTRGIRLTDEEYAFILANQLKDRNVFNFNRLLMLNAPLAQKINGQMETIYCDGWCYNHMPLVITLDEALEDALAILGVQE